jgi:FMN phosphatase YigB (HAD superfamily)
MDSSETAYFLDFDHTLFNTDEFFHVDVRNAFLSLGIDPALWEQSYAAVWPSGYTLEKHAGEVLRRSGSPLPLHEMQRILRNSFSDLRRYLFPDVLPFLQKAKRNAARLSLLSFGDPEWQRYKAQASHLGDYFDEMFFTASEGGKARLVQEHAKKIAKRVVVVDNDPTELDLVKDLEPGIETYWMNRVPDEMRSPTDELSSRKFFEARRYLERIVRHRHIPCRSLDSISGTVCDEKRF